MVTNPMTPFREAGGCMDSMVFIHYMAVSYAASPRSPGGIPRFSTKFSPFKIWGE